MSDQSEWRLLQQQLQVAIEGIADYMYDQGTLTERGLGDVVSVSAGRAYVSILSERSSG